MKIFYMANANLDEQISEIRRTIRLSMNGVVSKLMSDGGIVYKQNYGVTITRLKEIAAYYKPNHDLAQRLWCLQIRETMIMATLLEPVNGCTDEAVEAWINDCNQIELMEQICMNLLAKLSQATDLSCKLILSDTPKKQIIGFLLAARIFKHLNKNQLDLIIEKAICLASTTNFQLYKAIALSLSRFARLNKQLAMNILDQTEFLSHSTSIGARFIRNEVQQEIFFLDIL